MQLKFNISDQLYENYVLRFGVQGTYQRMRKVLEEMQNVDPNDRYFLVSGDNRRAIEAVFQTTIDDGAKLAKLLRRLNAVSIEGAEMTFTTDELERIDMQATFHGRTREQFLVEQIEEIKQRFLEQI
jgi:hypothetical protein